MIYLRLSQVDRNGIMHELAVTQSILETSLRYAQTAEAGKILSIRIVIGQFASFIDDSVEFYWNLISKETIAEGSILEFKRIPAAFLCQDCGSEFLWTENLYNCPNCRSKKITIQTGTEFYLESIEVE